VFVVALMLLWWRDHATSFGFVRGGRRK
jgi:hypothetical protein